MQLEIKNLSYKYKSNSENILKDLNLSIKKGIKLGVFGPNGAGKTTLISLLTGILTPNKGTINFFNEIGKQSKSNLGYVPQDFALYEELTMHENLMFFGVMSGLSKKEAHAKSKELISKLGLEKHQQKKVKHFSGGMKRRVNLAIGLTNDPGILILDEPVVGVDAQSKNAILKYLNHLNQTGTTIIYTSHELMEAEEFCDYFVFIDGGVFVLEGELQELLKTNQVKNLKELFLKVTGEEYRD